MHLNPDVFPMSYVFWHGKLSESDMKHHHPLEYAEIVEAERKKLIDQTELQKSSSEEQR